LSEINEKLKEGFDALPGILNIVKIFNMSMLKNEQKDILKHMALVLWGGMDFKIFKELAGYKSEHEIYTLKNSGWIMMDEESVRIWLHPLIAETVFNIDEIKPSKETCGAFIENLSAKIKVLTQNIKNSQPCSNADSRLFHDLNKTMARVAMKIIFRPIKPILPRLKEKYQSALSFLYKQNIKMVEYHEPDPSELYRMIFLSGSINNAKKRRNRNRFTIFRKRIVKITKKKPK